MTDEQGAKSKEPGLEAEELVAQADTGGRKPSGIPAKMLIVVPLVWSLFQLWYASPLPFMLRFGVLNDTEARAIHLAFAIFLAFTAFPAFKRSPRDHIPIVDWIFAFVGAFCAAYLFLFYNALAERPGNPTTYDVVVAVVGMGLLLEATRRSLGPPLMVVAGVFMLYAFAGPWMPEVIAHKGASLNKGMSHYWLATEGVYGVALGVSATMVFLFVLFGALLEQAGAGNYFIRVAFAFMGHLRGGPAKAAVVSSAMTGMISGSSIANVVTTGTFTIPLMKRVGFSAEKSGAVEVASSTNGQLTPPIMGAAAFLMVEYVGISLVEVIKHAFLPAIISYIALVYIVHLEAMKADLKGLPRKFKFGWKERGIAVLSLVIVAGILVFVLPPIVAGIKAVMGDYSGWGVSVLLFVAYAMLLWYASRVPDLPSSHEIEELPDPVPTVKAGLHYLLPVVVLVWCLMVERFSPGLSAFWATVFMIFIIVTQKPLMSLFRRARREGSAFKEGLRDLHNGLVNGARNMIGIGVATAAAGIVVGTVTLTGIGQVMTEFIEFISGGSLVLMLIFTAIISLILGMGLPTTANYIVVSSLMAPVIVQLGAQSGLIVPLIAVHMFVFYFGILADDTPPVGLAAFAAAAVSGGDPIKTGIQGFTYDIRTAILPFIFIFNTKLLMIGIEGPLDLIIVVVGAVTAMLVFAAATQGFFIVKSRIWETAALLLIAFTLFRPGFWWDMAFPPTVVADPKQIVQLAEGQPPDVDLTIMAEGETIDGDFVSKTVRLPLGPASDGAARLEHGGIEVREEEGKILIDNLVFGGPAEAAGLDFDWQITGVQMDADRPPRELMFIPAFMLLALVVLLQRRRRAVANA